MPRPTPAETARQLQRALELLTLSHIAVTRAEIAVVYELYVVGIGVIREGSAETSDGDPGEVYMTCWERHHTSSTFMLVTTRFYIADYTYIPFPEE